MPLVFNVIPNGQLEAPTITYSKTRRIVAMESDDTDDIGGCQHFKMVVHTQGDRVSPGLLQYKHLLFQKDTSES